MAKFASGVYKALQTFKRHDINTVSKIVSVAELFGLFDLLEQEVRKLIINVTGKKDKSAINAVLALHLPTIMGCIDDPRIKNKNGILYAAMLLLGADRVGEAKHLFERCLSVLPESAPPPIADGQLYEFICKLWCDWITEQLKDTSTAKDLRIINLAATALKDTSARLVDEKTKALTLYTLGQVSELSGDHEKAIEQLEGANGLDKTLKLTSKINTLKKTID